MLLSEGPGGALKFVTREHPYKCFYCRVHGSSAVAETSKFDRSSPSSASPAELWNIENQHGNQTNKLEKV
ncbi:hypothetical protein BIW11_03282, partial [Tropilaelaps mercedesae]